jgi:protein-S-isoprenylcysteine O-methyltransferase Ste14
MLARILRLPVVLFLLALTGGSVIHRWFPVPLGLPSFAWMMLSGGSLMLAALLLAAAALLTMRRHRTTVEPGQRPSTLVTGGVFGLTRNPIYVALVLLMAAIALMADAVWILVAAAVLWLLLDRIVIRAEERIVEEVFGEQYVAYKGRVRRWL